MADSIKKLLAKVSAKERLILEKMIELILQGKTSGMDVKKLAGHVDLFRVRKEEFRVTYRVVKGDAIIVDIKRRNDNTYNKF